MKDWKPITARISLFPTSPPLPSVLDLFKKTWNSEPDNFQKPLNPLLPASAKAKRGSLTVGCSVHPQRIDFSITSSTSVDSIMSEGLDLIEDVKRLNQELLAIITMLGKEPVSNSVNRVAFFVQFLAVEPNILEANKAVMLVIPEPYRIKLSDEEEFVLQINHPQASKKVGNVRMNFISKWSVERIQVLTVLLPASGTPAIAPPSGIGTPHAREYLTAGVSFDNNNLPTDKPLTAVEQSLLLLEGLTAAEQSQQSYGLNP